MSRARRFSLRGWLLVLLLPVLGVLIVAYAGQMYFRLRALIIDGFNQKLLAVSTTTAAFIDPADHSRLMEPLPITAMTHDPAAATLWALDVSRHRLMRIRYSDGMAEDAGIALRSDIDTLSNDLGEGNLLLGDVESGRFEHFSTVTQQVRPAFEVVPPISAVATIMRRNGLYVAGRDLRRVDLTTGRVQFLHELPGAVRDLTYDRKRDVLWGLTGRGDELLDLDPATGAARRRVKLRYEKAEGGAEPPPVELRTIAFERITEVLYGSATSLARIDPETGVVSDKGFLPGFGQEQGPLYKRYVAPMQRVMARTGLTYLYTQTVDGRDHITYGLDGTVGPNHSPLHSTDTLPESEVAGVQRLMTEGSAYTSEIQPWQAWGLLKSAFAPIFDEYGRPAAMTGADIDISAIAFQTREALVITFACGGAMLLLSGLFTLGAARRLTVPLSAIKDAALHAAAGDYSRRADVARPRELAALAAKFSSISAALGQRVTELRQTVASQRTARERETLAEELGRRPPLAPTPPDDSPWAWGSLSPFLSEVPAGGAVRLGEAVLAWVGPEATGDILAGAARRSAVALTAEALLRRHGGDPRALGAALEPVLPSDVAAWALLTPEGWRVAARKPGLFFRRKADRSCEEIAGASFATLIRPAAGEALILAGAGAPVAALESLGAAGAAALLRDWRQSTAAEAPSAYAVIGTA